MFYDSSQHLVSDIVEKYDEEKHYSRVSEAGG